MDVPPPGVGAGCPFPRDSTTGKICGFLAHAVPESPPDGDQMMLPVVVPSEILDPVHVCPSGALAVVAKPKYRTHMPKDKEATACSMSSLRGNNKHGTGVESHVASRKFRISPEKWYAYYAFRPPGSGIRWK